MTTDLIAASADRFRHDTAGHTMTVLHDNGLHRHLRFDNGRNEIGWFEIVTWPGSLAIRGGFDNAYVFSRQPDMFGFFRVNGNEHGINPGYWSESLAGGTTHAEAYSQDRFEEYVREALAEAEVTYPGVTAAWADHMEWNACADFEDQARDALRDFTFVFISKDADKDVEPFRFEDTFDWDLTDWDRWFLGACHAIVWAIARYDAARSAVNAAGVPA